MLNTTSKEKSALFVQNTASKGKSALLVTDTISKEKPALFLQNTASEKKPVSSKQATLKLMLGVALFVAVPLPLTGVWTGCLIAAILNLKYPKALLAVTVGNTIAALIVTVASVFFAAYINIMVAVFATIALGAVIFLLIKTIFPFRKKA
jgi:hypothetical protein